MNTRLAFTRDTEPAFCELTNTGPRLLYRGKLKIHRKSRVGRPTSFPRNLVVSCDSWHPQSSREFVRTRGEERKGRKKISWKPCAIWIRYLNKRERELVSFPSETPPSPILWIEISQSFVHSDILDRSLFRFDASSETFFVRFFEHTSEIVTFAPSCAPTTRRCMEQPETRAGLLSPRRLYELAQVSSPRSSRYSNMLFYGAIIGTVIIIKSEAVCSRVSSLSLSLRPTSSSLASDWFVHLDLACCSIMFNAIEYSQTNYQCMYIFFSPGKKESSFGKRKKELPFEKLRITSFIEFEKKRASCRRKKKRKITIFNSPREKKRKKIGRSFEGRKFPLSNESFFPSSLRQREERKRD